MNTKGNMAIRRTRDGRRANTPIARKNPEKPVAVDDYISSESIDPDFDKFNLEEVIGHRLPNDEIY
jgi:hypothetical protein